MALRHLLFLLAPLSLLACNDGPAPPSGTYEMQLTGTRTLRLYEEDPGVEEPFTINTSAVLYVDEGAGGQDLDIVWAQQGYAAPTQGRLFELRLFPYAFTDDASTTTLAGVFDEPIVEAIGVARRSGEYVSVQFEGDEDTTLCAYYEKVREVIIIGEWTEDILNVELFAAYLEACVDTEGYLVKNGFPEVRYNLEGTLSNVYAPFPPEDSQ